MNFDGAGSVVGLYGNDFVLTTQLSGGVELHMNDSRFSGTDGFFGNFGRGTAAGGGGAGDDERLFAGVGEFEIVFHHIALGDGVEIKCVGLEMEDGCGGIIECGGLRLCVGGKFYSERENGEEKKFFHVRGVWMSVGNIERFRFGKCSGLACTNVLQLKCSDDCLRKNCAAKTG